MSSYVWFRISTKMALIIDENAAIFGLKASLLCHVLSLSQLFVHLLVSWQWKYCWPNWWRFSGIYQTWRRSMTFHDNPCLINFAHFCKCLSFICWVELNFSQKKPKREVFAHHGRTSNWSWWWCCAPWLNPNVGNGFVCQQRQMWICALFATLLRYTWEEFSTYYTGKLLGWSSSHIPAEMFPWISLADLNHAFLVATRLDIEV